MEWVRYFDLHGNYGLAVENIVSENKVNNAYDANTLKRWLQTVILLEMFQQSV